MEQKILELLYQIQKDQKEAREETRAEFNKVHGRLGSIEARLEKVESKLDSSGFQFEQSTKYTIEEVGFLADKVIKLEKELYQLRNKQ